MAFGPQMGFGTVPNSRTVWMGPNPEEEAAAAAAKQAEAEAFARRQWLGIKQHTYGRANQLQNDPVQRQIIQQLRGVISGQNTPYNESTLNALQGQQARGSATAQAAQMETLRQQLGASGGSIYDPGYGAALRESDSVRQGQNMDYAGQLRAMAALENFNAQQNATRSLAGVNQAQNAQINQLGLAGAGFQAQRHQQVPTGGVLMPQYNPAMMGGGGEKKDNQESGTSGPRQPTGFTMSGTGYPGSAQMGQTPESNSSLAGPPRPSATTGQTGFSGPDPYAQSQEWNTKNAIGGYAVPGLDNNMLIDALRFRRGMA